MAKKTSLSPATIAQAIQKPDETAAKPVRINVHVPPDLHRAFKLKAVQDGRSHQDILLDAIRRYVSE